MLVELHDKMIETKSGGMRNRSGGIELIQV